MHRFIMSRYLLHNYVAGVGWGFLVFSACLGVAMGPNIPIYYLADIIHS